MHLFTDALFTVNSSSGSSVAILILALLCVFVRACVCACVHVYVVKRFACVMDIYLWDFYVLWQHGFKSLIFIFILNDHFLTFLYFLNIFVLVYVKCLLMLNKYFFKLNHRIPVLHVHLLFLPWFNYVGRVVCLRHTDSCVVFLACSDALVHISDVTLTGLSTLTLVLCVCVCVHVCLGKRLPGFRPVLCQLMVQWAEVGDCREVGKTQAGVLGTFIDSCGWCHIGSTCFWPACCLTAAGRANSADAWHLAWCFTASALLFLLPFWPLTTISCLVCVNICVQYILDFDFDLVSCQAVLSCCGPKSWW